MTSPIYCAETFVNGYSDPHCQNISTQIYFGEAINILEKNDTYWYIESSDGYKSHCKPIKTHQSTANYRLTMAKTPLFSAPNIKSSIIGYLYSPAMVAVQTTDNGFGLVGGLDNKSYIFMPHLQPHPNTQNISVVGVIEYINGMIGLPYIWGGRCGNGFDCSGLVQSALAVFGVYCPRDSTPQYEYFQSNYSLTAPLIDGDLVFWPGHVGIYYNNLLYHANAHHLAVVRENYQQAITRMAQKNIHIKGYGRFIKQ